MEQAGQWHGLFRGGHWEPDGMAPFILGAAGELAFPISRDDAGETGDEWPNELPVELI